MCWLNVLSSPEIVALLSERASQDSDPTVRVIALALTTVAASVAGDNVFELLRFRVANDLSEVVRSVGLILLSGDTGNSSVTSTINYPFVIGRHRFHPVNAWAYPGYRTTQGNPTTEGLWWVTESRKPEVIQMCLERAKSMTPHLCGRWRGSGSSRSPVAIPKFRMPDQLGNRGFG